MSVWRMLHRAMAHVRFKLLHRAMAHVRMAHAASGYGACPF